MPSLSSEIFIKFPNDIKGETGQAGHEDEVTATHYVRDVLRVLPHWPKDRYIELAAKYWAATRARLNPAELAAELGPLTVPPKLDATPTEQQSPPR